MATTITTRPMLDLAALRGAVTVSEETTMPSKLLRSALALPVLFLLSVSSVSADVAVDAFTTGQGPVVAPGSNASAAAEAIGTERDIQVTRLSGADTVTAEVSAGSLVVTSGTATSGEALVVWDGTDGNPLLIAPTGLGGASLTGSGETGLRVVVNAAPAGTVLIVEAYSSSTTSSIRSVRLPAISSATDVHFTFSDFTAHLGAGADFASVGAITLIVRTPGAGTVSIAAVDAITATPSVTASKTDSLETDVGTDGFPSPGDTVEYTVTIGNTGGTASGTELSDTIDANTALVGGSVVISPLALDDVFLTTSASAPGVLGNDLGTTKTISPTGARSTTGGGSATVNADGSFTYTPPVGGPGTADTFTYTITDGTYSDTGVVTVFPPDLAPTVSTTSPANAAIQVGTMANLTVEFSEVVSVTGSAFTLECPLASPITVTNTTGSTGQSFTLDPATTLPENTTCRLTVVAAQVTDADLNDPPDAMAANHVVDFTTDQAPSVTSTVPTNGTVGFDSTANIVVNFSEPVDVTTSSFTIECPAPGNTQSFAVTGSGTASITLDPDATLPGNTTCTVTAVAANISDTDTGDDPDHPAADHVFSFTTDAAPEVTLTSPTSGATNQRTDVNIVVSFSESVTASGTSATIECPVGSAQAYAVSGSGTNTITYNPTSDLPAGTTCTVTIVAGQIADVDANDPPDNMAADYVFSFTTDAAPAVTTTSPTNGATNQVTSTDITINFTEAVTVSTSSFTIECPAAGNLQTFGVSGSGTSTITLDPTSNLPAGTTCTVTTIANQVADGDSNDPPDNMVANHVFTFTTDAAPSVTTTSPTNGATQIAANTNVTINFNENVNIADATAFTLECPAATPVAFTLSPVAPGGTNSFTLDPTTDLPFGVTCTVTTVASKVTDVDSNDPPDNMAANHVFTFTVDEAPSVSSTTPADDATGVAPNTNITINFSEAVNVTGNWFQIVCGSQTKNPGDTTVTGTGATRTIDPATNLQAGNECEVTIFAAQVTDQDGGDPPDQMAADHVFQFKVPPVANADNYKDADGDPDADPTVVGNVGVNTATSTEFSLFTNDEVGSGGVDSFALPGGTATAQGGTIVVAADGKFTYTPPPGYEGVDTFTYNITNEGGTSGDATVTITVQGMIWFVTNGGPAGDGRLTSPFNSLAAFQALNTGAGNNPAAGDNIFVYENASAYTGPVTLLNNQKLIGQDATASLATISGVTVPPDSFALPNMNTGAPATTINSSTASVNAVNLAVGATSTIRGLTVTTGSSTSKGIASGASFGTLTVTEVSISGSGPALDLNTGTVSATFPSVSSSGGANGIRLAAVNGSLTINGGSLSGASSATFSVSGGSAGVSYAGTVSQANAARILDIQNHTTNGITLSGDLNCNASCTGLFASGNSSGALTFSGTTKTINTSANSNPGVSLSNTIANFTNGGLQVTTSSGAGFSASGGGTVQVTTGTNANTITSSAATALSISGTTIGSSGLTFRSINASGASRGILLSTTGSLGGLVVTGNGGNCTFADPTCTGGTIQSMTGSDDSSTTPVGTGIVLANTRNVSLTRMRILGTSNYGIRGTSIDGFTMANCVVNGAGGTNVATPFRDSALSFGNTSGAGLIAFTGTVSITNSDIRSGRQHNIMIDSSSGSSNITISGNTIRDTHSTEGDDGLHVEADTTANMTLSITNNTFASHGGDHFNLSLVNNAVAALTFTGNALSGGHATGLGQGVFILGASYNGTFTYNVSNNGTDAVPFTGNRQGGAIHVNKGSGTGSFSGRIENNVIGNPSVTNSGSLEAFGIIVGSRGTSPGKHTTLISGNKVRQYEDRGIVLEAGEGSAALNATVTNNTVSNFADPVNSLHGIHSDNGILTTDSNAVCLSISGNLVANAGNEVGGGADIRVRKHPSAPMSVRVPGLSGSTAADVDNKITADNPDATTVTVTGAGYTGGGACELPN